MSYIHSLEDKFTIDLVNKRFKSCVLKLLKTKENKRTDTIDVFHKCIFNRIEDL